MSLFCCRIINAFICSVSLCQVSGWHPDHCIRIFFFELLTLQYTRPPLNLLSGRRPTSVPPHILQILIVYNSLFSILRCERIAYFWSVSYLCHFCIHMMSEFESITEAVLHPKSNAPQHVCEGTVRLRPGWESTRSAQGAWNGVAGLFPGSEWWLTSGGLTSHNSVPSAALYFPHRHGLIMGRVF